MRNNHNTQNYYVRTRELFFISAFRICSDDIPETANLVATLAVGVSAGVSVRGGGEGVDGGVGGVGVGAAPAGQGEHAADSEARGAGAGGGAAQGVALRGRVASPIEIIGAPTGRVGEADHVENPLS